MKVESNVWLLTACQALTMCIPTFMALVGSIIGRQLAPDPAYATLPLGALILGSAVATLPVILSMRLWGRKPVFILCAAVSGGGGLLAMYALSQESFVLFLTAVVALGLGLAAGQQYRFAAMESVAVEAMPTAASRVLIGGIVAAFVGPEMALRGEHLFAVPYAGSFAFLVLVSVLAILVLSFFKEPVITQSDNIEGSRKFSEILQQPVLWVAVLAGISGFTVMGLVMTATPPHMHFDNGYSLVATKWIIQSHILAMFVPSFFVPWLVRRIGEVGLIILGIAAMLMMVVIIYSRYELVNYWVSLVLLGIGWNFLFVGGTALLPRAYRESEKYRVQAFNDFTIFGIQAGSALMSGWILSTYGWQTLLLITLPIIGSLVLAMTYWRWTPNIVERPAS